MNEAVFLAFMEIFSKMHSMLKFAKGSMISSFRWFPISNGGKNNAFRILELTTCRACFSFNESMVED